MSKQFKIILIVFVVVAAISGIVYFATPEPESITLTDEENPTKEVEKSKIPDGVKITTNEVSIKNGEITLDLTIKNTRAKEIYLSETKAILKDTKGKTIAELTVPINATIPAGEEFGLMSQDFISTSPKVDKVIYIFETEKNPEQTDNQETTSENQTESQTNVE